MKKRTSACIVAGGLCLVIRAWGKRLVRIAHAYYYTHICIHIRAYFYSINPLTWFFFFLCLLALFVCPSIFLLHDGLLYSITVKLASILYRNCFCRLCQMKKKNKLFVVVFCRHDSKRRHRNPTGGCDCVIYIREQHFFVLFCVNPNYSYIE